MIIVLLANGFEEIEALTPVDMLRRADFDVKTVSVSGGNVVGAHGIEIKCDATPEDIDLSEVEMAIFPGGMPGATNLDASPYTDKVISAMLEKGGGLAAICAAPLILGRRGVLAGKMATCYPGFEKELLGANIINSSVVVDGNIVTAKGMGVALEFAEALITLLSGAEKSAEISASICVRSNDSKDEKSNYAAPNIELISACDESVDDCKEEIEHIADTLNEIFDANGIAASLSSATIGARVIRFDIIPEKGVRANKILNLEDDIALSVGTGAVRFIAPIPGKTCVGIEIPRKKGSKVGLRQLMESEEYLNAPSKTVACFGRNVEGKPVIANISKLPHLLIAGATGMGKSLFLHSTLVSLIYKASPEDVKLIIIDPKCVECTSYRDIPHLIHPIITDTKKAIGALMWAVKEMESRYCLLNARLARNIDIYNEKVKQFPALGKPLPKIVIVIDELADLMLQDRSNTENYLARLCQKARAVGIHIIVATQRPSTNVITGVIKANIPSRVCFKVLSSVDSMTVLDRREGTKLLHSGDALYASISNMVPERIQSAYVRDSDIDALLNDVRTKNGLAIYDNEIINCIHNFASELAKPKRQTRSAKACQADDSDETPILDCITEITSFDSKEQALLYQKQFLESVELALTTGRVSTALIQRKLAIGYGKAAKFIDLMEKLGIASEADGQKPRRTLLTLEEWNEKLKKMLK